MYKANMQIYRPTALNVHMTHTPWEKSRPL